MKEMAHFLMKSDILCNPRDREATHRAEMEGIATEDATAVTCRNCLDLLHKLAKEKREQ
jgi:hypothetical protein